MVGDLASVALGPPSNLDSVLVKSLNYWSMPGGLEGKTDPRDFIRAARRFGFEAIEMGLGDAIPLDATEAHCRALRKEAEDAGLAIPSCASTVPWKQALGDADPSLRAGAEEDLRRMLRISHWLGSRTLLVIPGIVDSFFDPSRPTLDYAEVEARAAEGLRRVLPEAASLGVRMGIENVWNKFLLSPTEMRAFIDRFESPFVGAYVDVANILPYGHPHQWLRILAHRVVGVHFKDFRKAVGTEHGFVDLCEGDVPWPEVLAALEEIGYDGPVVAEMIPNYPHLPLVRVANASTAMDALLKRGDWA